MCKRDGAVRLEPPPGGVLARASEPGFNPNSFAEYPGSRRVNRAVADAYEPGSIFKIVTAAAGLQEHCLLYTSPSPRDRTRSRMPPSP